MKTFRVTALVLRGRLGTATVASDGTLLEEPEMKKEIEVLRGYTVEVYDEDGTTIDETFYGVAEKADGTDDSEEVLEEIRADFPPTEYQNNEW